jgi:hypothetical protein
VRCRCSSAPPTLSQLLLAFAIDTLDGALVDLTVAGDRNDDAVEYVDRVVRILPVEDEVEALTL